MRRLLRPDHSVIVPTEIGETAVAAGPPRLLKLLILCAGMVALLGGAAWAGSWEAVFASHEEFCRRLAAAVDTGALSREQLRFDGAAVHSIDWQPATLSGEGPPRSRCASFDQARADVFPGGMPLLAIRSRFCMKGVPSESLYLFPGSSDVLERATWQDLSPLHATLEKFERTGGRYRLAHVPDNAGEVELRERFVMDLVVVDERASVALTAPPFTWIVVGRPHGQGTLQEQCYLRRTP